MTWGILWDFASLPQRGYTSTPGAYVDCGDQDDRTPEQLTRFKDGLCKINVWYSHAAIWTLILNTPLPPSAVNTRLYEQRGWCQFELNMSALVSICVLEVKQLPENMASDWEEMFTRCKRAGRQRVIPPDEFAKMMRSGVETNLIEFTAGADLEKVVIPNYKAGFTSVFSKAIMLGYGGCGWTDDDLCSLARALRFASAGGALRNLRRIYLYNNRISDPGFVELAGAFADGVADCLEEFYAYKNAIGDAGAIVFANMLLGGGLANLKALDLRNNSITAHGRSRLQDAVNECCELVVQDDGASTQPITSRSSLHCLQRTPTVAFWKDL